MKRPLKHKTRNTKEITTKQEHRSGVLHGDSRGGDLMNTTYQTLLHNCRNSDQIVELAKTVHILCFPYDVYVEEHHKQEHSLSSSYEILDIFVHFENLLFFVNCVDVLPSDIGRKILVIIRFSNTTEFTESVNQAEVEAMLEIKDNHFFCYFDNDDSDNDSTN